MNDDELPIHELKVTSHHVTGFAVTSPYFRVPEKRWTPIRNPGPGGEAYNLLFQCMRFQRRDEHGEPIAGGPVKYDPQWDDRTPIAFAMPPLREYSSGPNRLWSTVVTLPNIDARIAFAEDGREELVALMRRLVDAPDADAYRVALVDATRWLAELDHEDYY